MSDRGFREVVAPLFDGGEVAAVEWTMDMGWAPYEVPAWAERILSFYGDSGRLYGHGFAFSPLSGEWRPRQEQWLENLGQEVQRRNYQHVSEHACFSYGGSLANAGPLPVPKTPRTVELGRARLERFTEVAGLPVGLENLATSLGPRDALDQGSFLDELLRPTGGFVVLDVHNLYCQCENFALSPETLLASYPLSRVREIHVSGGSWDQIEIAPDAPPFRRDTHDDAVPDAVFDLLRLALARCPNVEAVFLERLPFTFETTADGEQFRTDYRTMAEIVRQRSNVATSEAAHA